MRAKFLIVALVFALASMGLSMVIWPNPPHSALLTGSQMPFFIFLGVVESLAFGLGVSFLIFGWSKMKTAMPDQHRGWTWATFIAITWLLISWWPHDNMHRVNAHDDIMGLLRISYLFHFTLIVAGLIIARFFWQQLKKTDSQ